MTKGKRSKPKRRALTDAELAEVCNVVATGGDGPLLDFALTWAEFELGARRGGILTLAVGQLDHRAPSIGFWEKGNLLDAQPCSLELIDFLAAFAESRGGGRCTPGHPTFDPNAPVFHFKDSTEAKPHAVTGRRFDTLHGRVQRALPWANSMSYTGHALRHTIGSMVERHAGFETARLMLRHAATETTNTLTKASTTDVARAIAEITGRSRPLVTPKE